MKKPLIIAHRGASADAPENTLEAFALAHRQGADGIELDIFLTRDRHLVVTHDENTKRLTGVELHVWKSSLKALKELDYGEGEKIPTLDEVFDLCRNKFEVLNIEIKSTGYFTDGVEEVLVKKIREWKMEDRVIVSSFNPLHLLRMKRLAPMIKRGFLVSPDHWRSRRPFLIRLCKPSSLNLDFNWLTPNRYAFYKKMGIPLWVWFSKEEGVDYKAYRDLSATITNYPERVRKILL